MRKLLLTTVLLGSICSGAFAQEALLQKEGKFLNPPNLSTGGELLDGYDHRKRARSSNDGHH